MADRFAPTDSASTIILTDYDSDFITYAVNAQKDELALFSECTTQKGGKLPSMVVELEMLRANTRCVLAHSAGKHTVEFRFEPRSIRVTDGIAYAALAIMLLTLVTLIVRTVLGAHHSQFFGFSVCVKGIDGLKIPSRRASSRP